ncbi:MAG: DegT/DnrJ/EryC1/StrS family aminotransferase [Verrucomicrobiae bacterium]|nr:DegT/DnrJ/EryC1/StrS family aminotransferase [Verrucomicrobiae bacterium]
MNIPVAKVDLEESDLRRVEEVVRSGWIMQGPKVEAFERAIADFCGARHAVAVTSGTTALHLMLHAAGIGLGDEVVVPSFSWIATANCVAYCGATPSFCDVDLASYNMTPPLAEAAITPRTKAILAVHQFGMPCDLDGFARLARERGVMLFEDAACAIGSESRGVRIGGFKSSVAACLSFHPRKVLTTGEGGMLLTNDAALAEKVRQLRNHGLENGRFVEIGYNFRMTDLQAALGIGQVARLPETLAKRRALAEVYRKELGGVAGLRLPEEISGGCTNVQSFMVRFPEGGRTLRDRVASALAARGIATRPGIAPIHLEPCYAKVCAGLRLPNTERLAGDGLVLPLYASLTPAKAVEISHALLAALRA